MEPLFAPVGFSHRTRGTRGVPSDPPDVYVYVCGGDVGLPACSGVAPHGTPVGRHGTEIGPVRLRRPRSHLARGRGWGYGGSRGRGPGCATRVEGVERVAAGVDAALVGVRGDPVGTLVDLFGR